MRLRLIRTLLLISALFTFSAQADTPLYQLSFKDSEQQPVSLERYRGKVLLLNFWATWCPPCVKEMPSMERLRQQLKEEAFEVVAINAGEPANVVNGFLAEMSARGTPLSFPILLDEKGRSFREFGLRGLPMSFIFDAEGNRLEVIAGEEEWDSEKNIARFRALLMKKQDRAE